MSLTKNKPKTAKKAVAVTPVSVQSEEFDQLQKIAHDVRSDPANPESMDDERRAAGRQALRERETHRKGEEDYYGLRKKWSWFIFGFIAFMLLFQLLLTVAIGFKFVDFEKYPIFLHLIIGENFAQIIGMGIIVAKYLFPKQP